MWEGFTKLLCLFKIPFNNLSKRKFQKEKTHHGSNKIISSGKSGWKCFGITCTLHLLEVKQKANESWMKGNWMRKGTTNRMKNQLNTELSLNESQIKVNWMLNEMSNERRMKVRWLSNGPPINTLYFTDKTSDHNSNIKSCLNCNTSFGVYRFEFPCGCFYIARTEHKLTVKWAAYSRQRCWTQ